MLINKVSRIYANSLNVNILVDLEKVLKTLQDSDDLKLVLLSPTVSLSQKNNIIDDVFGNIVGIEAINFLKVLAEKKHFNELENIIEVLKENINISSNIQNVVVISAVELNEVNKNRICSVLEEKLNKRINADWQVDENIIGGLIVKINDDVIDTSIKLKIEKIKGNLW